MVRINLQQQTTRPAREEFEQALADAGFVLSGPVLSGDLVRVATSTDKGRKKSGWYIYYDDPVCAGGAYGSWKDGFTQTWCGKPDHTLTAVQLAEHRQRIADMKRHAEEQRSLLAASKADEAEEYITTLHDATSHDYLAKKRIQANGALIASKPHTTGDRVDARPGELIIPAINIDREIQTYQRIAPDGTKMFFAGGAKDSTFFPIGDYEDAPTVAICEGYATGCSIYQSTSLPVIVSFDSGNMVKVAAMMCAEYPQTKFVICGDNDQFTNGNPGEKAAMEAANHDNARYVLPVFKNTDAKPTDFNDLFCLDGASAVVAQIVGERVLFAAEPVTLEFLSNIPRREFLYGVHLIRGYTSCTIAPGGVGKTQLAMIDCVSLATGKRFTHNHPHERCNTWHFNLEDPKDELRRRLAAILQHFKIDPSDIVGRVFINSGRDQRMVIAERTKDGQILPRKPDIEALRKAIIANKIGLISIDPFVKSHYVDENSNKDIDEVLSIYAQIAHETGCAFDLVHHISKPPKGHSIAGDIDAARGASALTGAVRSARTLVMMTEDEAKELEIDKARRKWFVREDNAKANMSPPSDKANWYQRYDIKLDNGDNVGVLDVWKPSNPMDKLSPEKARQIQEVVGGEQKDGRRYSIKKSARNNWAGAAMMQMALLTPVEAERILKEWMDNGVLYEAEYEHDGEPAVGLFLNRHKLAGDAPF